MSKKVIHKGNFLQFSVITDDDREWEFVERISKRGAVNIIPIIKFTDTMYKILLIRQFRRPINNWVLEFPAGMVDEGENYIETAYRELQEETGYTITEILHAEPPSVSSEGLSNEKVAQVTALVEYDRKPNRELTEQIENITVDLSKLKSLIDTERLKGTDIGAKVLSFYLGMEINNGFNI